jgi:hypothetical protein
MNLLAPGWWMPEEAVSIDSAGGPIELNRPTWRTGTIRARLKGSVPKASIAGPLRITIEQPPFPRKNDAFPKSSWVDCAVGTSGDVACEVPAGTNDLAVRLPGMVPHYRWGVAVPAGGNVDLGTVVFRKGGSISGWVVSDDSSMDTRKARVRLVRLIAGADDPIARERLERAVAQASVSSSGFFQLSGIAEGTYRLLAEAEGGGKGVLAPVEVKTNAESALRTPLRISPPLTLRVEVQPHNDWRNRPWTVRIDRLLDYSLATDGPPLVVAPVSENGSLEVPNVECGTFNALVLDADENTLASKTFTVTGAENASQVIEMSVVRVQGEVRDGDEEVAAELWFGGRFGEIQVHSVADEHGAFELTLPKAGEWDVDIQGPGMKEPVQVRASVEERDGSAHVLLTLPQAVVTGRVVDETGVPRANARVTVSTTSVRTGITDADGTFRIASVPPGQAILRASLLLNGVRKEAVPVRTEVRPDAESGPYELRLGAMRTVHASVVSRSGPVVGASVSIYSSTRSVTAATTDVDGSFQFDVPSLDAAVSLVVGPPGYALRAYNVPADGNTDLVIHAAEAGGTIHLQVGGGGTTVSVDGVTFAIQDLIRWSISQGVRLDAGGTLTFPNLSPGVWRFCSLGANRCKEAMLAPGADISVDLSRD